MKLQKNKRRKKKHQRIPISNQIHNLDERPDTLESSLIGYFLPQDHFSKIMYLLSSRTVELSVPSNDDRKDIEKCLS